MAPKQTKKEDQGKKPNEKKEALVMKYRLWAKSALAPYPAEDGSPLYTGDLEAEEFLGEKRIAESRNATNCEWLLRPGMALSFYAAAVRVGWKELKAAGKDNEKVEAMMKANAAFTGALKVLDVGKSKAPDRKDIKASVSTLVDFLQGISEADRASICKLALRAAKLYLMCMHLLEAMDLVRNPKLFAKKMSKAVGSNKTTEEALSWMKHPEDTKRLKEMLNKALQKKVSKHQALAGKEKKRRHSTASSGSAGAASAATASDADSSDAGRRRGRKRRQRSSSSPPRSSSSDQSDKKNKKAKKDDKETKEKHKKKDKEDKHETKEKKRSQRRSRSSSSGKSKSPSKKEGNKDKKLDKKRSRSSKGKNKNAPKETKRSQRRSRSSSTGKDKSTPKPKQEDKKDKTRKERRSRSSSSRKNKNPPKPKDSWQPLIDNKHVCLKCCTKDNLFV